MGLLVWEAALGWAAAWGTEFVLILGECDIIFYIQVLQTDRKLLLFG